MHCCRIVALDEVRRPTAPAEKLLQLLMLDAGQHGRIADLIAVQMQDRQHGAVGDWIEELIRLPCCRQGARLCLAIADDARDDQLRVIERRAEGMAERIAEFAAFMDGPGGRRRHVTRNAAGKRELLEQLFQSGFILGDVRINLAPRPFEIDIAHQGRAPMTRTGDVDHVQIMLLDHPVEVDIDEVLAWRRSPMSYDQRFDVSRCQRRAQERVVVEIDLPHRQVIGRPPVGVHPTQFVDAQRLFSAVSPRGISPVLALSRQRWCVHFFSPFLYPGSALGYAITARCDRRALPEPCRSRP